MLVDARRRLSTIIDGLRFIHPTHTCNRRASKKIHSAEGQIVTDRIFLPFGPPTHRSHTAVPTIVAPQKKCFRPKAELWPMGFFNPCLCARIWQLSICLFNRISTRDAPEKKFPLIPCNSSYRPLKNIRQWNRKIDAPSKKMTESLRIVSGSIRARFGADRGSIRGFL